MTTKTMIMMMMMIAVNIYYVMDQINDPGDPLYPILYENTSVP